MREIKFKVCIQLIGSQPKILPIHLMDFDGEGKLKNILVEYPLGDGYTQWLSYDYGSEKWNEVVKGIMQYTGLKDRNGKEIYEGDIIKTPWGIGKVFMRLGCWFIENLRELGYFHASDIEVIGNIYEHKYLLEEGKDD